MPIFGSSWAKIDRQSRLNMTNTRHQKASSSSGITCKRRPEMKFIPWKYPVSGSYALQAFNILQSRFLPLSIGNLNSALPGKVLPRSFVIFLVTYSSSYSINFLIIPLLYCDLEQWTLQMSFQISLRSTSQFTVSSPSQKLCLILA